MNIDSLWEKISAVSAPMRSEGCELHFPVAAHCAFLSSLLGKVLHFALQNCAGLLTLADAKNRTPQKRCPVFLVRPEGFEPPTF